MSVAQPSFGDLLRVFDYCRTPSGEHAWRAAVDGYDNGGRKCVVCRAFVYDIPRQPSEPKP